LAFAQVVTGEHEAGVVQGAHELGEFGDLCIDRGAEREVLLVKHNLVAA
jgi:hypothetical protein